MFVKRIDAMTDEAKRVWKTVWLGAVVVSAIMLACWIWRPNSTRVPEELLGEWRTADPSYAGRALKIDEVTINFETGDGKLSVGFITGVRSVQEGSRTLYTISYSSDGMANEVSFFCEGARDKIIKFRNQENTIWTKESSS